MTTTKHFFRCRDCNYEDSEPVKIGESCICGRCGYDSGVMTERPDDPDYDTKEHRDEANEVQR